MTDKSSFQVPNLERALKILEFILDYDQGLSVSEIARHFDYPTNSVYRICHTLALHGYLNKNEADKKFTLSHKLMLMGRASAARRSLSDICHDVMVQLRDRFKETVCLSVMADGEGVVIDQVPGLHPFRFVVDPGTRHVLHVTAPTKALLAFLPQDECEALLADAALEKFTEQTICSKKAFREELKQIKKQGYALDRAECLEGVLCAAVPVLDEHCRPLAAITVTGPAPRLDFKLLDDIGREMVRTARSLNLELGCPEAAL